jgi:H+/Cl- antiporter ClcA
MSREPSIGEQPSRSCPLHEGQLSTASIKQAHNPGSRFAAIALVWIVRARATAPAGEVTPAMSLGANIGVLIGIGHERGIYPICTALASAFRNLLTG